MLSRFSGAVKRLFGQIQKIEHVGTDRSGNKYFKRPEEIDGTVVEKRWIEFGGPDKLPDPTTVPVEWTSWLAGTRPHAPSDEEMSALEMRRTMIKFRASVLEKEEEKRKFRARSLRQAGVKEQSEPHDVTRVMDQIAVSTSGDDVAWSATRNVGKDAELPKQRPGSRMGVQKFDPSSAPEPSTGAFQPDAWQPGGSSSSPEPSMRPRVDVRKSQSGQGSVPRRESSKQHAKTTEPAGRGATFQPGAWQPD